MALDPTKFTLSDADVDLRQGWTNPETGDQFDVLTLLREIYVYTDGVKTIICREEWQYNAPIDPTIQAYQQVIIPINPRYYNFIGVNWGNCTQFALYFGNGPIPFNTLDNNWDMYFYQDGDNQEIVFPIRNESFITIYPIVIDTNILPQTEIFTGYRRG